MTHWKQLRKLIESIAFLHQFQRRHVEVNGEESIEAEPIDLELALAVLTNALSETLQSVSKDVKELYDYLCENASESNEGYTYKDLMRHHEGHFGEPASKTTLRDRYIEPLVELGLLDKDESKRTYRFSVVTGKKLAHPADFKKALEEILSGQTKAKIEEDYLAKFGRERGTLTISGKNYDSPLTLSNFAGLKSLLSRSKKEEYGGKASEQEFARCASAELEKKPQELPSKDVNPNNSGNCMTSETDRSPARRVNFVWRRIPVAEKCELCGTLAVEYEIKDMTWQQVLRRCKSCFAKIHLQFSNAAWEEEKEA